MTIPRRTLASPAAVEGVGLFTERRVRCVVRPAPPGAGLAFRRTDLPGSEPVPARITHLCAEPVHPAFARIPARHTALAGADGAVVYTTEHLLGALAALGLTDALVELDAPELPIGDGSALLFTGPIGRAGIRDHRGSVEPIAPRETVRVESPDGSASVTAEPIAEDEPPSFTYRLDYGPNAPIPPQEASWRGDGPAFLREIAPARTFSLAAEAAQMQALGLFRSFTPRDLLVVGDGGEPIENAWRVEHEPARHKLLDLIGDLALAGRPVHARVTAVRAGHALNHALARLLADF